MLVQVRCSRELAKRLGAKPLKVNGRDVQHPWPVILVEVDDYEPWYWVPEEQIASAYNLDPQREVF